MSIALPDVSLRRLIHGFAIVADPRRARTPPAMPMQAAVGRTLREQRGAPRHNLERDVLIRRRGELARAGKLMNISETGAAVRVQPPTDLATGLWPYNLSNGDDVWLTELLDDPVSCWVIGVNHDVLRVRFAHDDTIRPQIRALIEG